MQLLEEIEEPFRKVQWATKNLLAPLYEYVSALQRTNAAEAELEVLRRYS